MPILAAETITISEAWEIAQSYQEAKSSGSLEEIHRIIHTLIDKIVVLNDEVSIKWSFCKN
jgi:hypothetical protein